MSNVIRCMALLAAITVIASVSAQDLPPGSGKDPTPAPKTEPKVEPKTPAPKVDTDTTKNLSEALQRIKENRGTMKPPMFRISKDRFVAHIPGDMLGIGWTQIAEKAAPAVYKDEVAEAVKAKAKFVKKVTGVTLVAHKSSDSFTHAVFGIIDHKDVERLINVPLVRSVELANATADFLQNAHDDAEMRTAFLAAIGGGAPAPAKK